MYHVLIMIINTNKVMFLLLTRCIPGQGCAETLRGVGAQSEEPGEGLGDGCLQSEEQGG